MTREASRKVWSVTFAAFCGLLLAAAPVLASGGAEEGGEKVNLFAGDFGNALWTAVIFILLLVVLGKYAWGPLLSALQAREAYIRDSLEEARREHQEAEERLKEYTEQLATARSQAEAVLQEAHRHAAEVKQRLAAEARTEADAMIARARQDIELATENAVKQVYAQAAHLVTEAAAKVIGQQLKSADHERLVAESIASIERLDLN